MAADEQNPQNGQPGDGPGDAYVDPNGIVLIGLYLVFVAVLLLLGLQSAWPACEDDRPPTITSVKPASGPASGATQVILTGMGFQKGSAISFGGAPASDVVVSGATLMTAHTPAHAPGKVEVEIQSECSAATMWRQGFTYNANTAGGDPQPPAEFKVDPPFGPINVETSVKITGGPFVDGDTVTFGGAPVAISEKTANELVTKAPARPKVEKVDVVVLRGGKPLPIRSAFAYVDQMTVSKIEPSAGSIGGCETVSVTGSGFVEGMSVMFGVVRAAAVAVNGPTSLTLLTPSHAKGKVDVVATLGSTARLAGGYSYVCPLPADRVLFVMVILAGALGGALHAMRSFFMYVGTRKLVQSWIWMYLLLPLIGATIAVVFYIIVGAGLFTLAGGQPGFTVVGLSALVGMFSAQAVEKLKGIAEGIFSKAPASSEHLTQAPLAITTVNPAQGSVGQQVTISGSGFVTGGTAVAFGTRPATNVVVVNDKQITATAPGPAPATPIVDVTVTAGGKTATKNQGFTYTP